jgi:hypothetical protein
MVFNASRVLRATGGSLIIHAGITREETLLAKRMAMRVEEETRMVRFCMTVRVVGLKSRYKAILGDM